MVDQIIVNYLNSNKRLVVPGLGAFLRKEPNDVVFIEFLKKDDGVLSALLCSAIDISAEEANAMITNYVSVINRQLRSTGRFSIEGLGELELNANGVCDLVYNAKQIGTPKSTTPTPTAQPPVANPFAKQPTQPISTPQSSVPTPQTGTTTPQTPTATARPVVTTPPVSIPPVSAPKPTATAEQQPKASVQHETVEQKPSYRSASGNNSGNKNVRPKAKMDTIMLLAIIIAIVAVIALLYGVLVGGTHSGNLFDKDATSDDIEMIDSDSVQQ